VLRDLRREGGPVVFCDIMPEYTGKKAACENAEGLLKKMKVEGRLRSLLKKRGGGNQPETTPRRQGGEKARWILAEGHQKRPHRIRKKEAIAHSLEGPRGILKLKEE